MIVSHMERVYQAILTLILVHSLLQDPHRCLAHTTQLPPPHKSGKVEDEAKCTDGSPLNDEFICNTHNSEAWMHNLYVWTLWNTRINLVKCMKSNSEVISVLRMDSDEAENSPEEVASISVNREPCGSVSCRTSYSSVWCYFSPESGLQCRFENLYYSPLYREFVFALDTNSVIYGIDSIKSLQKHLSLSSLDGHNAFQFLITVVPYSLLASRYKFVIVQGKSLIMSRFKPDNLQHTFHDDLLPIYFTMRELCTNIAFASCAKKMTLVIADDYDETPFWDLYQAMSGRTILTSRLEKDSKLWYCFENVKIGLNRVSVWYQYGFGRPQGPQLRETFSGPLLYQFTDFVKEKLGIQAVQSSTHTAVLMVRKQNRKILNEEELARMISDQLGGQKQGDSAVKVLSMEENSLKEIIEVLSQAQVAVGMHGAALILGMFLPPGSVLVELWPYGIHPNTATVYRTMCSLRGSQVLYVPWVNEDAQNTMYHPEYPSHYGGLGHLSMEQQEQVVAALHGEKLTSVVCCDSPDWLFRIYQDTTVRLSVQEEHLKSVPFSQVLEEALKMVQEASTGETRHENLQLYPSRVQDVVCYLHHDVNNTVLVMEWKDPWNMQVMNCERIGFEVIVQIDENDILSDIVYGRRYVKVLKVGIVLVNTWIMCFCDGIAGFELFHKCVL